MQGLGPRSTLIVYQCTRFARLTLAVTLAVEVVVEVALALAGATQALLTAVVVAAAAPRPHWTHTHIQLT